MATLAPLVRVKIWLVGQRRLSLEDLINHMSPSSVLSEKACKSVAVLRELDAEVETEEILSCVGSDNSLESVNLQWKRAQSKSSGTYLHCGSTCWLAKVTLGLRSPHLQSPNATRTLTSTSGVGFTCRHCQLSFFRMLFTPLFHI
jgi:hypothetical protein